MATCIMAVGATGRDLFEFDGQPLHFFNAWVSSKQGMKPTNVNDTVDGRNPAPSGMAENHSFDKPPFLTRDSDFATIHRIMDLFYPDM